MFTKERLILDRPTGATGLDQTLVAFAEVRLMLSGIHHYIPQLLQLSGVLTAAGTLTITPPGVKSPLQVIIDDLESLKRRSNEHFKPSKHAMRSARFYLFETYARMGHAFPRPSFVLDGEKGIIIKWVHNGYTVRLNCLPDESDDDYIYFENGEYDTEDNVTIDTLHNRLNWLIQHEREYPR